MRHGLIKRHAGDGNIHAGEITGVFAAHGVNVEELASERTNAAMDGGMLFQARATVFVPNNVKLIAVRTDLEKIAADLMVDLKWLPVQR